MNKQEVWRLESGARRLKRRPLSTRPEGCIQMEFQKGGVNG
jgi:hypothetical protein